MSLEMYLQMYSLFLWSFQRILFLLFYLRELSPGPLNFHSDKQTKPSIFLGKQKFERKSLILLILLSTHNQTHSGRDFGFILEPITFDTWSTRKVSNAMSSRLLLSREVYLLKWRRICFEPEKKSWLNIWLVFPLNEYFSTSFLSLLLFLSVTEEKRGRKKSLRFWLRSLCFFSRVLFFTVFLF